jgi:hypothetical protein
LNKEQNIELICPLKTSAAAAAAAATGESVTNNFRSGLSPNKIMWYLEDISDELMKHLVGIVFSMKLLYDEP